MKTLIDRRWSANHGIGRFSMEILKEYDGEEVEGDFSDIFSVLDPFKLYLRNVKLSTFFISPSYNAPIFYSSKSVITIHDLMHINFPYYAGIKNKLYYNFLVKHVCKKSPLIFTVSEFTKQEIVKWAGIKQNKVVVVYNGVDDKYHINVMPHQASRPYIFYIGDKKPHKNLKRLIEAFSLSSASNTHILMMSGVENHQIKEWALEFGVEDKIKFAGFIPEEELPSYYKGAALLALPSLYEGFGLPIIEAMAVGTPVLTSNLTSMPEIADNAALLVNPYNTAEIATGIDKLVTDNSLRESLIEKGLIRASFFNWDKSREIWNESLSKIIGNGQ